ncbi:MAG TPA: phosphotransferase [Solirubrobacteraceae bacterium]|nr:phosphotransferase [Solirubrobacteraceae bacterium]
MPQVAESVAAEPGDRLILPLPGIGELPASLVELTATKLTVRLASTSAQTLTQAQRLDSASLVTRGEARQLGDLVVRRTLADGAETVIDLEVLDPGSRATLWDVWDRMSSGEDGAAPEDLGHGDVPARGHYTEKARRERLRWIRAASGAPLGTLDDVGLDVSKLTGNIENLVGSVEIPVGLAGPLLFDGANVKARITAPLATTEGALVASATRGSRAITRCGGVRTQVLSQRMSRGPVYELADLRAAVRFGRWVNSHLPEIAEQVGLVSQHARLVEVRPIQSGRVVNLRFNYETGDAAGQNMTTACTWRACQWINEAIALMPGMALRNFRIEGNASGDKKVNYLSVLDGRGMRVTAECVLDHQTVVEVLKTTPQAIADTFRYGMLSGIQSGMMGHNINVANLVAGIFTATGQDIACVHESSIAILSIDAVDGGLYASMLLPALIVGTLGGGTNLPNQRDYLDMMGCAGAGKVERLAEIVAGFALALDLSTIAAVSGGQFADAHERLGRNRPVEWLTREDLRPEFFTPMLAQALDESTLQVTRVTDLSPVTGSSIITEVTGQGLQNKITGLLRLRLDYAVNSHDETLDVVAKIKPLDSEVILTTNKIASLCGGTLAELYPRWREWTGFKDVHTRELGLYEFADQRVREVMPRCYGVYEDEAREAYVILMEDLGPDVVLKDSVNERDSWSERHVDAALRGIAQVHGAWLGREDELVQQPWLGRYSTAGSMLEMAELWLAIAEHNATEYPEWIDEFTLLRMKKSIAELDEWWPQLEAMPRTLVHNDFNPRNIALRADGLRLVAYDWELATIHVPQRDVAELLAFTMPLDVDADRVEHHIEAHRVALGNSAGVQFDPDSWRRGYQLALRDFTLTRLQLYMMAHTQRQYEFLDELVHTVKRLLRIEGEHNIAAERERRRRSDE